ncbi:MULTISPECIES: hydroxymethylglutaryl-CoA lyase [unclassified Agrococcus]|uniref:hydroxymethylglutaryl-CoA lyase n=1 Tax=unclassified Agrococcus TaxID=2615065 RepID=UPI0036230112
MSVRDVGLPERQPLAGAPDDVTIWEVAPRDGLQAEAVTLDVDDRIRAVRMLAAAGLPVIEVGSFVRADRVPQMAGSDAVLAGTAGLGIRTPVLTPNLHGYHAARAAGAQDVAVFLSVTETFARENLGMSRAASEAASREVVAHAKADGVRVRGYLSMVFGDPWEGHVPVSDVVRVATLLREQGVDELSLGDTIGVATPGQVRGVVDALADAGIRPESIALHMHDTYGTALANVLAGLEAGVRTFDAAAGGIGGCPFARSATGNLATDDLVWMLDGMGVRTGVDLDALTDASAWLSAALARPTSSRVARALMAKEHA